MGVWIGMDDKRISLGKNLYGSTAALPIFAKTMNQIYNLRNYNIKIDQNRLDHIVAQR